MTLLTNTPRLLILAGVLTSTALRLPTTLLSSFKAWVLDEPLVTPSMLTPMALKSLANGSSKGVASGMSGPLASAKILL